MEYLAGGSLTDVVTDTCMDEGQIAAVCREVSNHNHELHHEETCFCETKAADQLCGDPTANKRLSFHYIDSTIPLLPKCEISSS